MVEGDRGAQRYLILDDFIDGGDTVRAIISEIFVVNPEARCVGFIAYKRLSYMNEKSSNFEEVMDQAWWDDESNYQARFFPEHQAAVEKEAGL